MIGKTVYTVEQLAELAKAHRSVTSRVGWIRGRGYVPASVLLRMQCSAVLDVIANGLMVYEKKSRKKIGDGKGSNQ